MVKILVSGKFPPYKTEEGIKAALSKNKPAYPDFIKKVESWGTLPEDGEYKAYAVYECPNDKLYDGIKAIIKRYHFYVTEVEEYEYSMEILYPEAEVMQILMQK